MRSLAILHCIFAILYSKNDEFGRQFESVRSMIGSSHLYHERNAHELLIYELFDFQ